MYEKRTIANLTQNDYIMQKSLMNAFVSCSLTCTLFYKYILEEYHRGINLRNFKSEPVAEILKTALAV